MIDYPKTPEEHYAAVERIRGIKAALEPDNRRTHAGLLCEWCGKPGPFTRIEVRETATETLAAVQCHKCGHREETCASREVPAYKISEAGGIFLRSGDPF